MDPNPFCPWWVGFAVPVCPTPGCRHLGGAGEPVPLSFLLLWCHQVGTVTPSKGPVPASWHSLRLHWLQRPLCPGSCPSHPAHWRVPSLTAWA